MPEDRFICFRSGASDLLESKLNVVIKRVSVASVDVMSACYRYRETEGTEGTEAA